MLPGGARIICMISRMFPGLDLYQHMFPVLDLYYTDLAQHLRTESYDLDYLYRDLSEIDAEPCYDRRTAAPKNLEAPHLS